MPKKIKRSDPAWRQNKFGGQSLVIRVDGHVIAYLDTTYNKRKKIVGWEVEIMDIYKHGAEETLEVARRSAYRVAKDVLQCGIENLMKVPT